VVGRLAALLGAVVGLAAASADADTLIIDGLEYADVQVVGVEDGNLLFLNAGGREVKMALLRVNQIYLDRHPQIEQAVALAERGQYPRAVTKLKEVQQPERWLRPWLNHRLTLYADKAGDAQTAVRAYLEMVSQPGTPSAYFGRPPLASLEAADDRVKKQLAARLGDAASNLDERHPAREYVRQLLVLAGDDSAAADKVREQMNGAGAAGLVFTNTLERNDPITQLLVDGQYEEAAKAIMAVMDDPVAGGGARRLYQLGLAQRGQADKAAEAGEVDKAQKLYRDAGLSFMRVVAHYPHPQLGYKGPALLEVGYIHLQIGRPDKALELLNEAASELRPELDPQLIARLENLQKEAEALRQQAH